MIRFRTPLDRQFRAEPLAPIIRQAHPGLSLGHRSKLVSEFRPYK
jgi:hypothetical protein